MDLATSRHEVLRGTVAGIAGVVGKLVAVAVAAAATFGLVRGAAAIPESWYASMLWLVPPVAGLLAAAAVLVAWWGAWGDWARENGLERPVPTREDALEPGRISAVMALCTATSMAALLATAAYGHTSTPGGDLVFVAAVVSIGCLAISVVMGLTGYDAGRVAAGGPSGDELEAEAACPP